MTQITRRAFIGRAGVSGAGLLLGGCAAKGRETAHEVGAVEDLMREHGVLRRALLVYEAVLPRLRQNPTASLIEALHETAKLFHAFGENYHEKKLEEAHIFPTLKKQDPSLTGLVDTLINQHERGRQITGYILTLTRDGKISADQAAQAAGILKSFVLMYQNHAAREDTVVFPAWKTELSARNLEEMGEKFEEIEHRQFGEDGFEEAVDRIAAIENSLGLQNIAQFTPQPPPGS